MRSEYERITKAYRYAQGRLEDTAAKLETLADALHAAKQFRESL